MFEFAAGIAVGAVFAPFWMGVWNTAAPVVKGWFTKETTPK